MSGQPLISLAVIARDEAASMARLLDFHRGLWDEAVVVDTGSRDGTADLAQAHGARVAAFAWCDDFSAARNAALALCRGRWVLVLDADECVAATDQPRLRALAATAEPAGFLLPQWNYADDGGLPGWLPTPSGVGQVSGGAAGYVVSWLARFFPGDSALRFRGRVHESIEWSLVARGLPLIRADIPIHHQGHRAPPAVLAARRERDGRLLRLKLHDDPGDPRARYEMGVQLLAEGQPVLARRLLERLVAEAPAGPRACEAHGLLGRLALAEGRGADACSASRAAVAARPDLAETWLDLIRVLWLTGDRRGARKALEQLATLFPADPRLPAVTAQVQASPADNG